MTTWDVLGLGCVAVDDLLYLPAFPEPDSKLRVLRRERGLGGLTATALVAASRLGARCAFAGVLGDDEDSRYVLGRLAAEGIDVSPRVVRAGARPIHSTILVDETAHTRTILYDLAGSTGADPDEPPAEVVRSAGVLLVDHYGALGMTRAARLAREAGRAVVADFERHDWPGFAGLLALVDHLIVSLPFARSLTGAGTADEAVERLWGEGRELVAVTAGADGCWYRTAVEGVRHQPAFRVAVRDTTGCGDVFHGAYAAAVVRGMGAEERVRWATAAAALKAARAEAPTREAVEAFLQTPVG